MVSLLWELDGGFYSMLLRAWIFLAITQPINEWISSDEIISVFNCHFLSLDYW